MSWLFNVIKHPSLWEGLGGLLLLCTLASCSEADDTEEEYPNWKATNEAYFESQYQAHSAQTATSFILRSWTKPESVLLSDLPHTDCILVDVIESGAGVASPYYTDTVSVHYSGRLLPSTSYPKGYEFDRSYLNTLDPDLDVPQEFRSSALTEGFSTAVQHMHRGDHWRVTVPYQLGYGTEGSTTIPGYSTLIFDIWLVDFWTMDDYPMRE